MPGTTIKTLSIHFATRSTRDGWRAGGLLGEVEALPGEKNLIDRYVSAKYSVY